MSTYIEIRNATVENIRMERNHGHVTIWLTLDYSGGGQGFGGYGLGLMSNDDFNNCTGFLEHWVISLMNLFKVEDFYDIAGKPCRVKATHDKVHSIGHFLEDKWFTPADINKDKV